MSWRRLFGSHGLACLVTCVLVGLWPARAAAQAPALGARDGVFTVSGEKKFLLFFSYFGAKRDDAAKQRAILNTAKSRGFDGARVFPNWWRDNVGGPCDGGVYDPHPLMGADGRINDKTAGELRTLLTIAAEEGMLIQLALAYEPVAGMTFDNFKSATGAVATGLRGGFPHVSGFDANISQRAVSAKSGAAVVGRGRLAGSRPARQTSGCRRLVPAY